MQEHDSDNKLYHYHGGADSLPEIKKRAIDKKHKRKEETHETKEENKQKYALETVDDKQDLKKKITKKEGLEESLLEYTEKLKKWEEIFDDWSSSKAKEMAKLVAEETNAEEEKAAFCRQREKIKEDIARLELESKELAKKIIKADNNKNKLVKKRKKFEDRTEEKLYEHKIEKAKLQDSIQKTKFQLTRVQDQEGEKLCNDKRARNEEKVDLKAIRIDQLAKEIEEKERDLECPVCFELCNKPIFMCDLSHQICKECKPKMKFCPQCREPYKNHKMRHKVKEMTSDKLQILYKNMKELLETE